jgi:DNA-binding NtrC family response regulator
MAMDDPQVRVVVIDDDPLILSVIQRILQRASFDTIAVPTVSEGKAAIERHSPHLVISDIYLGGDDGDGYDLIAWVKANRPNIPVIAMSGGDINADQQFSRAGDMGAAALLEKPVRASAVIDTVNTVLKQHSA